MPLSPQSRPTLVPRVVIVDADRRVQQSLADLLSVSGDCEVVGRAGDVRGALQVVERTRPDAVLVDPRLPDIEAGIALIRGLETAWPGLRVVVTGWSDTEGHSVNGSAPPYVSKGSSPEEFVSALMACCR